MKCPKCKTTMLDKCCPRCGYLESGATISLKDKPEKYIDEKNINKDFDKLFRNQNNMVPTLFGGFYLAYHKCVLSASLIHFIEIISMYLVNRYIGAIPYFGAYAPIIIFLLFIIFRLIYGAISNSIILFWDKKKIAKFKKKYKDYSRHLYKYHNTNIFAILLYFPIYALIVLLFLTDTFK